jgi:hypothetical protein
VPLIKAYKKQFGDKNTIVLPYEMFVQEPGLFFNTLSKKLSKKIILPKNSLNKKLNVKDNKFILYITKRYNLIGRSTSLNSFKKKNKFIAFILKVIYKVLLFLPMEKLQRKLIRKLEGKVGSFVGNRYKKSNNELSNIINIDLKKYGY